MIVFEDESGVSLLPSVRATWAPRGCTPVLRHRFAWKRLSLAGALAYEPDGSDAHLLFELRPGAYNDETLIARTSNLRQLLPRARRRRVSGDLRGRGLTICVAFRGCTFTGAVDAIWRT